MIKILALGDLHGDFPKIKFEKKDFDLIVLVGDIMGDNHRKYIKKLFNKEKKTRYFKFKETISKIKLEEFEKKNFEEGRKILKTLNTLDKPIIFVPGNHDNPLYLDSQIHCEENYKYSLKNLLKGISNLINVEYSIFKYKGIVFSGIGSISAPEPINYLERFNFEDLQDFIFYNSRAKFNKLVIKHMDKKLENEKNIILISHNSPYNSKLDLIRDETSPVFNNHYGSKICNYLIGKYEPILCLSGHIHESYGKEKIKKTMCINCGFGGNVNTLIKINSKTKKIENIKMIGKNKI
jgi:Icc-related predicted phosphoesterase